MEQILEDIPVTLEVVFGTAKVKLEKFISWCEKRRDYPERKHERTSCLSAKRRDDWQRNFSSRG